MAIEFVSVKYIERCDLFKGCQLAWDAFILSGPKCQWGSNSNTLVNASYIFSNLENMQDDDEKKTSEQISEVLNRIKTLGFNPSDSSGDFRVDLES